MNQKTILRVIAKLLIPPIILFAFYVQFHGDYGPGGGFQAGVILATAYILYALIFGVSAARRAMPAAVTRTMLALGVLIYSGTGITTLLLGGDFLDYSVLAQNSVKGQEWGIFSVEFGVGMTVAGAIITIFYAFAGHVKEPPMKEPPVKTSQDAGR